MARLWLGLWRGYGVGSHSVIFAAWHAIFVLCPRLAGLMRRVFARWIAAAQGCDARYEENTYNDTPSHQRRLFIALAMDR
ncbi:MAG: hypothetical protein V4500_10685 [Pseudomonadota bacterium]